jgi:hypothetical protein
MDARKCLQCGKCVERAGPGRKRKYCSRSCRYKYEYVFRAKECTCVLCGSSFASKSGRASRCPKCHHYRERTGVVAKCKACGKECYGSPCRPRTYCSYSCAHHGRRGGSKEQIEAAAAAMGYVKWFDTGNKCLHCGKPVMRRKWWSQTAKAWRSGATGKKDQRLYCDKSCARLHYWGNKNPEAKARKAAAILTSLLSDIISDVVNGPPCCAVCRKGVPRGRTVCSKQCREARGRIKSRMRYEQRTGVKLRPCVGPRPCKHCGVIVMPTNTNGRGRSVCDRCSLLRARTHSLRAAFYGCEVEPVSRLAVFERDGWRCQLCGNAVLRKTRANRKTGRLHPRTASLDHIVPLSRGGGHIESNCQCACLRCNIRKHNRLIGQKRLF